MTWVKDWTGEVAALIGSGPSASQEWDLDALVSSGVRTVVINNSWRLLSTADILYGCDWHWWFANRPAFSVVGPPRPDQFLGELYTATLPTEGQKKNIKWNSEKDFILQNIKVVPMQTGYGPLITDDQMVRGNGNSAAQAANMLYHFGVKKILLIGIDCDGQNSRWHSMHDHDGHQRQDKFCMPKWIDAWDELSVGFKEKGVDVINCSVTSRVRAFRKMRLIDALDL